MYVKTTCYQRKLTTLDLNENVGSALEKNWTRGDFLSLPVFDGEEFKGILMKEAIYRYFFWISNSR